MQPLLGTTYCKCAKITQPIAEDSRLKEASAVMLPLRCFELMLEHDLRQIVSSFVRFLNKKTLKVSPSQIEVLRLRLLEIY